MGKKGERDERRKGKGSMPIKMCHSWVLCSHDSALFTLLYVTGSGKRDIFAHIMFFSNSVVVLRQIIFFIH